MLRQPGLCTMVPQPLWLWLVCKQRSDRFLAAEMAARACKARIGCARLVLADATATTRSSVSKGQAEALVDLVRRTVFTPGEQADLMSDIESCGFEQSDLQLIVNSFADMSVKTRRQQQDFGNLLDFFVNSEWQVLSNAAINQNTKVSVLVSRAIALGCRCPTEPCYKTWASLVIALRGSEDGEVLQMGALDKHNLMKVVKSEFKKMKRRAPSDVTYLHKLPPSPSGLPSDPLMTAYSTEKPIQCPIPTLAADVARHDLSFACRAAPQSCLSVIPTSRLQSGGGVSEVASFLMQGMQQMVQQQQIVMQTIMHGYTRSSLQSLQNVRNYGLQGPLLEVTPPPKGSFPRRLSCEELGDPTPWKTNSPTPLALPPLPDENEDHDEIAVPVPAAPVEKVANPSATALLDMLDERESAKKIAKRELKLSQRSAGAKDVAEETAKPVIAKEERKVALKRPAAASGPVSSDVKKKTKTEHAEGTLPTIGVEWTRSRVQCRTGLRGEGQNFAIRWGLGCKRLTVDSARKEATTWLAAERKRRGL